MSTSNLSLWINPRNNTILSGFNSLIQAPQTVLTQGDDVFVDIHMIETSSGQSTEIPFPANSSIKCAIGRIDRFPTEGNFTFQYESDIVQIPIPSSIESVNSLINGLPSVIADGGVVVYFVNATTYRVVFNTVGPKSDCVINTTGLYPNSTATVTRITTGTALLNEVQNVKLKTTPVAYADTFTLADTPTISIVEITTSIFRISISDALKYGSFTVSNGTKTTAAINWDASGSDLINALTASGISSSTTNTSTQYSVTKNDTLSWDVSRVSGSYESLSVSAIGFAGFSTMTGSLNMNTIEVEDLLSGALRVSAILEIELTAGPIKQTLYQGEINIVNDLIDNATYSPIQFPSGGGGLNDAPQNGLLYGRKDGAWSVVPEADLTGFELNELNDVAINEKLDKDLLSYEQSTNLWKNKSAASLGLAELSGATFTGLISSNTAAIKTNNSTVATTSFVRNSVVPAVVETLETNYIVTHLLGWNTMVRVLASSNTTIQVNADYISSIETGTKIIFLHEGSSVITFVSNGCSIISREFMRTISGYGGVVTLMKTATDQWVLFGDLAYTPYGFVYSSECVESEAADYSGTVWTGYFLHQTVVSDGAGGTITSGVENTEGCWHPYGWVYDVEITDQYTLSWDVNDYQEYQVASGTFAYHIWYSTTFADGEGGTIGTGYDTQASSGDLIYSDNFYDSQSGDTIWYYVIYDGTEGYYVTYSPYPL
jgi:hypothetical protein